MPNYEFVGFVQRKVPGDSPNRLRGDFDGPPIIGPLDPYFQRSNDSSPSSSLIFFPGVIPDIEFPDSNLENLLGQKEVLVAMTREYIKDQVDLWRQIPFLALEADLRVGAPFQVHSAYTMGRWAFGNGREAGDADFDGTTCVDLETGDLLTRMPPQYIGIGKKHLYRELGYQPAPDSEVFRLLETPDQLSAEIIIQTLREVAHEPFVNTISPEGIREYKAEQAKHYGITPVYTRIHRDGE